MTKIKCERCNHEFRLPRYKKLNTSTGYCCSMKCWNDWWNDNLIQNNMPQVQEGLINCQECKYDSYRKYAGIFCSKTCCISNRNKSRMASGTHEFQIPGFIDNARAIQLSKGLHPFQSGNMNSESLKLKAEGISKARIREKHTGTHIWQRPFVWINNEFSRSLTVVSRDKLSILYLYISDCELQDHFKIGWTRDSRIRSIDTRTHLLNNVMELRSGIPLMILELEKDIKLKFYNEQFSIKNKTTEIFPNSIKSEVLDFINKY